MWPNTSDFSTPSFFFFQDYPQLMVCTSCPKSTREFWLGSSSRARVYSLALYPVKDLSLNTWGIFYFGQQCHLLPCFILVRAPPVGLQLPICPGRTRPISQLTSISGDHSPICHLKMSCFGNGCQATKLRIAQSQRTFCYLNHFLSLLLSPAYIHVHMHVSILHTHMCIKLQIHCRITAKLSF